MTDYLDRKTPSGTILGQTSASLLGFWGTTPVDQPAALTAQSTTLTFTAATTADYAVAAPVQTSGYGFANGDEAQSTLIVVQNLQARLAEIEARLEECGLIAAN